MTEPQLPDLVVPSEAIDTVLDWLKAEQVRIVTNDRTGYDRSDKLDWITDIHNSLRHLKDKAVAESNDVVGQNDTIYRRNLRLAKDN